jgi:hypothetical protein
MVYTVTQLITDAYYTSGIVGKEFETVSGSQAQDGLANLNFLLGKKSADKGAIPYFLRYNNTMVIGQEQYFIPGLITTETLTYQIPNPDGNNVRYACRPVDRKLYWATPRANNIQSLPYNYFVQREFNTDLTKGPIGGGASVYFYFLPSQAFPFEIWGLFALTNVALNQDLSLTLDEFYQDYLRFELAVRLCKVYNYAIPPGVQAELDEYYMILEKREQQIDLHQQSISPLSQITDGLNYAWANLGTGWSVP